jgi:FMN reductase
MRSVMKLVCVVGSVAKSHRTRHAIEVGAQAAAGSGDDVQVEIIDLSERAISMADGLPVHENRDATAAVISQLVQADCVVLSTPIYRGTFTGALKNLLDLLPLEGLEGKAVGLLATGATDHHSLAIDLQLRGVLAWFNAYLVPGSVYLTHVETSSEGFAEHATARLSELGVATVELARCLPKGPPKPFALARTMRVRSA